MNWYNILVLEKLDERLHRVRILHRHAAEVKTAQPASLKESRPVESRVVLRVVVGKVRGDIVAGIPSSRGDVLLDNGRLCLVDFS